jgi:hypothetical protein
METVLKADYSIPHCEYQKNSDGGFTIKYGQVPVQLLSLTTILGLLVLIGAIIELFVLGIFATLITLIVIGGF